MVPLPSIVIVPLPVPRSPASKEPAVKDDPPKIDSVPTPPQPIVPATHSAPAEPKPREPGKLPDDAQPIYYSALRATEWLKLANKPDGRFVYGFQPSLRVQLDGSVIRRQFFWSPLPSVPSSGVVPSLGAESGSSSSIDPLQIFFDNPAYWQLYQ